MVSQSSHRSQPQTTSSRQITQGRIVSLEISNFKSYGGVHQIGPFQQFTAVIGPNGTGKSNLMDAISFVLGVRTQPLRGLKLRDLLFSKTQEETQEQEQAAKGYVKLIFENSTGQEIQFQRGIQPAGADKSGSDEVQYKSTYRVDGREKSFKEYVDALKDLGVLVEARNFLVFQGEIEGVAQMQPIARTKLIEQISGSNAYEKEYERLNTEKARLEDKVRFLGQKKKQMQKEVKEKKEEKTEADKYEEQLNNLKDLQLDKYMLLLYQLNQRQEASSEESEKLNASIEDLEKDIQEKEQRVEEKKKNVSLLVKSKQSQDKKVSKAKKDNLNQVSQMQKVQKEVQYLEKSLRKCKQDLTKKGKEREEQASVMAKLEEDLKRVQDIETELNQTMEQHQQQQQIQISQENIETYYNLKNQVGVETSRLQNEISVLQQQQQAEFDLQNSLQSNINNAQQELQLAKDQQNKQTNRIGKQQEAVNIKKKELENVKKLLKNLDDGQREQNARREVIQNQLAQVEKNLSEARVVYNESKRDKVITQTLQEFMQRFKGVYGKLTDLAKIPNKKYNLAATVILSREMDSIVVDNEQTAKQCIEYLRANKIFPMNFIPLETVDAKELREDLRQLGGSCVLLVDVLEFKKDFEKAFLYAAGSTVICNTVKEAKYVALEGEERLKVVSLDGTVINKNGLMTGGITQSLDERSKRWTDDSVQQLRNEKQKYLEELTSYLNMREVRDQQLGHKSNISRLQNEIKLNETDIKEGNKSNKTFETKIKQLTTSLEQYEKQLNEVQQNVDKVQKKLDAKKKSIDSVSDNIYSQFSSQLGIQNIREFEENQVKQWEEIMSQKTQLSQQKAKINAQLSYEKTQDLAQMVAELQIKKDQQQEQLQEFKGQLEELSRSQTQLEESLQELEEELNRINTAIDEQENESKAITTGLHQLRREVSKFQSEYEKYLQAIEQDRDLQLKTIQEANMEEITIPMQEEEGGEAPMEVDIPPEEQPTQTQGTQMQAGSRGEVNFDDMKDYLRGATPSKAQKYLKDLKEKIQEGQQKLQNMQVNLKANEQFQQALEREKEQVQELNQVTEEYQNIRDHFNDVRLDRINTFQRAFEHISASIDPIYKELTKSREHILGGSAYMSLENQDEPFNGGLIYAAVPPSKAYRHMEELSGGERTLASLALLFAIHSYRPSPFFVLDEVDSALDASNLMRVASYLRKKTRRGRGNDSFQAIVISLKEKFFSTSDCLVGTCRDQARQCSKVLTLDLNQYDIRRNISGTQDYLEEEEDGSSYLPQTRSINHNSQIDINTPA